MSYLDKCASKTDLFMNKLKPSRNLIVFIVSENCYVAYTLNEMKEIMASTNNHYCVEHADTNKLKRFFYLPNGIRVDSSLKTCFENKVNTMKLVKSENKFYLGFEDNKQYYSYYSVEPVLRQNIGSDEDSTFNTETTNNDSNLRSDVDSDVEIDIVELKKQRDERKAREMLQIERKLNEERNTGDYIETKNYENGVECKIEYKNRIKRAEKWFINNRLNRDNDLSAWIIYYENGNKKLERWWYNDQQHRNNDNPAWIEYYENGNKQCEYWWNNDQRHRDNDLPACIDYYENGNKQSESWWNNDQRHRDNDKPARIVYYENGNKKSESWWVNGQLHRDNDLPAFIEYYENGNKQFESWWINDQRYRNNDLPVSIHYT